MNCTLRSNSYRLRFSIKFAYTSVKFWIRDVAMVIRGPMSKDVFSQLISARKLSSLNFRSYDNFRPEITFTGKFLALVSFQWKVFGLNFLSLESFQLELPFTGKFST